MMYASFPNFCQEPAPHRRGMAKVRTETMPLKVNWKKTVDVLPLERQLSAVPEQNEEDETSKTTSSQKTPDTSTHPQRPESKGLRMPSFHSRPALARTPNHLLSPQQEKEGLSDLDQGVLITEVAGLENDLESEEETSDDVQEEGVGEGEVIETVTIETVDAATKTEEELEKEYDTDLDDEEEKEEALTFYQKMCQQFNIAPISYFLRHMKETDVTMRYHGLGTEDTIAIAMALKSNIFVERLDISGNWILPEGGRAISKLLEENEYLTEIVLADNRLGNKGAEYICHMLNVNGGLKKLNISGNDFDDKSAPYFADALQNNKFLRHLDLSHNSFTEVGADILGPAVGNNDILTVLDLSWNHLRHRGGIAIARGLKENIRLKVLNLSWNGLGLEGGAAVADAMMVNQSLQELDLTGNRLGMDTAQRMAKVLATNDTIKTLRMGNNLITSGGAIALITAVNNTDSCELQELDLTDVAVEYEFLRVVEDTKVKRPDFVVKYGQVMRAGNTFEDLGKPGIDPFNKKKDPVVILKEHIVVNDMRLVDILKRYDPDGGLSVTPEDFVAALEELAVPYNKKKVQEAVQRLATIQSGGRIYFGDFVSLEKDNKHKVKAASEDKGVES